MLLRTIILLFISLMLPTGLAAENIGELLRENEMLKLEIPLAQGKDIYYVFDLNQSKVSLKARGATYREFPINSFICRGKQATPLVLLLKGKNNMPKRQQTGPEESGSTESFDIKALELDDMPEKFTMEFENNLTISVLGQSTGFSGPIRNLAFSLRWRLCRPVISIWNAIWGKPSISILLTMDGTDAKALFWHMRPGAKSIISLPDGPAPPLK